MPNRILKETICTREDINALTADEEVFLYRLTVNCDDFGLLDARPSIVRAKCYPLRTDKIKLETIEKWIASLQSRGIIGLYTVDGITYLSILRWEQQKRANHAKYPPPPDGCYQMISDDINCDHVISDAPETRESRNENRETRNEKRTPPEPKVQYAEFVSMREKEYNTLVSQFGEEATKSMIAILDNYKGSRGKTYKDDYRAILNWVVDRWKKEHPSSSSHPDIAREFARDRLGFR